MGKIKEQYIDEAMKRKFLNIMYEQLKGMKEEETYFNQALLCLELGLKPSDIRINEQIALTMTSEHMANKKMVDKKNYHIIDKEFLDYFENTKNSPEVQAKVIKITNEYEDTLENFEEIEEELEIN